MNKIPDRVKIFLAIHISIAAFLVGIVRQLFDTGLVDRLVVSKGPLLGVGLPDLFVVLCAIIAGVYSYYAVMRLRRDRHEQGALLCSGIATAVSCMVLAGPLLDNGYHTHFVLCIIAAFIGFIVSLNINIRILEREERAGV